VDSSQKANSKSVTFAPACDLIYRILLRTVKVDIGSDRAQNNRKTADIYYDVAKTVNRALQI